MKKKINKFYLIYDQLKKYNIDCSNAEIIKAANDLIKFSKNDYIDKSYLREHSNDNRRPLDKIFSNQDNQILSNYYFLKDEEKDQIEEDSYLKFTQINNLN